MQPMVWLLIASEQLFILLIPNQNIGYEVRSGGQTKRKSTRLPYNFLTLMH